MNHNPIAELFSSEKLEQAKAVLLGEKASKDSIDLEDLKEPSAEKLSSLSHAIMTGQCDLKEVLGVSERQMTGMCHLGYKLYEDKKYKEAAQHFQFLMLIDSKNAEYRFYLAASFHQQELYDEAIGHYIASASYSPEDPIPYFYLSDCFIHLHDIESAIDCLGFCAAISEKDLDQHLSLHKRSLQMKKMFTEKREIFNKNLAQRNIEPKYGYIKFLRETYDAAS